MLGLVEQVGPVTPYRLKQTAEQTLAHLWSIRHTPLYTECGKVPELTAGMRVALQAGIGHEREYMRFWRRVGASGPTP